MKVQVEIIKQNPEAHMGCTYCPFIDLCVARAVEVNNSGWSCNQHTSGFGMHESNDNLLNE